MKNDRPLGWESPSQISTTVLPSSVGFLGVLSPLRRRPSHRHRPDDCSLSPVVEEELVNSQTRSWLDRGGSWSAISAKHRCMERGSIWEATGGSRPPGTRSGTPRDRCPRPDHRLSRICRP